MENYKSSFAILVSHFAMTLLLSLNLTAVGSLLPCSFYATILAITKYAKTIKNGGIECFWNT